MPLGSEKNKAIATAVNINANKMSSENITINKEEDESFIPVGILLTLINSA